MRSSQLRIILIIGINMVYRYDKEFVKRLMIGRCTDEEKLIFNRWIEQAQYQEEIEWMKNIWEENFDDSMLILGMEEKILGSLIERIYCSSGVKKNTQSEEDSNC